MSAGLEIAGLPVLDDPTRIRAAAGDLKSCVRAGHATAADIHIQWCRLAGAYNAPEQGHVIAAMTPPSEMSLRLIEQVSSAEAALSAYADRLAELDAQRRALVTDLLAFTRDNAEVEAENADNNVWDSLVDHYRSEAVDLARREDALHDRVVALQVAKDRAEVECANAIGDLWGTPDHHLNGETNTANPYRYGYTTDGYDQQARSGQTPWGRPASWTEGNVDVKLHRLDQGAKDSVGGIKDAAFDLAGWHGEGRAEASRSGITQLGNDVWNQTRWSGFNGATEAERQACAERLGQAGLASVGYGTWSHDGWHTAGGFVPDVAASYFTGGAFLGARTAGRGALSARVPRGMRLDPATLAPAARSLSARRLHRVQIGLNDWLETHLPSPESPGLRLAAAGVAPEVRPQATPPPSLWAMDTGQHAKGSAGSAGQSSPRTVAGHDVPPVDWGSHAEIGDGYSPQIRAAVTPIIDKAVDAEPAVTRDFLAALPDGARAHGLEHRIKSPDSLASKIDRIESQDSAGASAMVPDDVLRYTSVVSSDNDLIPSAHSIVNQLQEDGWVVKRVHHSYVEGNRYKGIHCAMTSETRGVTVELQFHSEHSIHVKDQTHGAYETVRAPETTQRDRIEATRWSQNLNGALPAPPGLGNFTDLGGIPVETKTYSTKD